MAGVLEGPQADRHRVPGSTRCRRRTRPTSPPTTSATTSRSARPSPRDRCGSRSSTNRWCDVLCATAAGLVNRHDHPHAGLRLHDLRQVGLPRALLGRHRRRLHRRYSRRSHTLVAYESDDPMSVLFIVKGPLVWLDEKGEHRPASSTCTTTSRSARSTTSRSASAPNTIDALLALTLQGEQDDDGGPRAAAPADRRRVGGSRLGGSSSSSDPFTGDAVRSPPRPGPTTRARRPTPPPRRSRPGRPRRPATPRAAQAAADC